MPVSPFADAFGRFFDSKRVATFLAGAVAVAVLGNAAYDLLKRAAGDDARVLAGVAAGAVGLLVGAAGLLTWWAARPGVIVPPRGVPAVPRRGLVLLVSRAEPCREVIRHHRSAVRRVWLVCSPDSAPVAQAVAADPELTADGRAVEVLTVDDVYDPRGVFDAVVGGVFGRLPPGWTPADVIGDFTGLTAPASVGLVLGCLQAGGAVEYTPAEYDADRRPVRPLPPVEVTFARTGGRPQWRPHRPAAGAGGEGDGAGGPPGR